MPQVPRTHESSSPGMSRGATAAVTSVGLFAAAGLYIGLVPEDDSGITNRQVDYCYDYFNIMPPGIETPGRSLIVASLRPAFDQLLPGTDSDNSENYVMSQSATRFCEEGSTLESYCADNTPMLLTIASRAIQMPEVGAAQLKATYLPKSELTVEEACNISLVPLDTSVSQ